jgi:hypothetical protein
VSELKETIKGKDSRLLLSAFGIGLSWGSTIIQTNHMVIPDIIEYTKPSKR